MVHRRIVTPSTRAERLDNAASSRASENSQSTPFAAGSAHPVCQPSEHSTHASASARANPAIAASSLRNPRRKRSDISICTLASPNAAPAATAPTSRPAAPRQHRIFVHHERILTPALTPNPVSILSRPRVEKRAKTTSHSRSKSSTERRIRSPTPPRRCRSRPVRSLSRLSMGRDDRECPRVNTRGWMNSPTTRPWRVVRALFPRRARTRGLVRRGWDPEVAGPVGEGV